MAARLVAFGATPRIRKFEGRAAAIFRNSETPLAPGKGPTAAGNLRFLEWFLQDYSPRRGEGPLLGEFADGALDLGPREEELLLACLLTPMRAWEVTEVSGLRGLMLKDVLTGAENSVGVLGFSDLPIRSDILICRLLPAGRIMRPGFSLIRLPAASREEMLAYVRTAYQMARPARHVSLEDFLDGAAHLYHHFFALRGKALGGCAQETVRRATFAPGKLTYLGRDTARIRAGLNRQMELEQEGKGGDELQYAWVDLHLATVRASLVSRPGSLEVRAETREDLAEAGRFVEVCLRGLVQPADAIPEILTSPSPPAGSSIEGRRRGAAFLARLLDGWSDRPSPLLNDQTPRDASTSRTGRQRVGLLLLGLERDLARQKRLGRAWVDLTPVRERLDLLPASPLSPAG